MEGKQLAGIFVLVGIAGIAAKKVANAITTNKRKKEIKALITPPASKEASAPVTG